MTNRQRMIAALRKQPVDRVPYGVRMDQWYNWHVANGSLPARYKGMSAYDIIRSFHGGIQGTTRYALSDRQQASRLWSAGKLWKETVHGVKVDVRKHEGEIVTEYVTPVGTVSVKEVLSKEATGSSTIEVEHLFKDEKDYAAIEYIYANTEVTPDYEGYYHLDKELGEDGVLPVSMGYSPTHYLMRVIMGYDRFFYELADHPEKVERLLRVMEACDWNKVQIMAKSPAITVQVCGNWVDGIHTPVFKRYMTPWFQRIGEVLHGAGKLMQCHIDGEMKRLVPLFLDTGIDVAEAYTPSPMTKVTTKEIRAAWGEKVTIWGGIPTVMFDPTYSEQEFDDFVLALIRDIAPGNAFIMGMGDNVPVTANFDRVVRVEKLLEQHARVPIKA